MSVKPIKLILSAVDDFTKQFVAFNNRVEQSIAPVKRLHGALATMGKDLGFGKFQAHLQSAGKHFGNFKNHIGNVGDAFGKLSLLLGAGAGGFVALIKGTFENAGEIHDTAIALGMSSEALQEFHFAAGQTGVTAEKFNVAMSFFNRNVAQASQGVGPLVGLFSSLNIKLTDSKNRTRSTADLFTELSEKFKNIQDASIRSRIAFSLFGRGAFRMTTLLMEGGKGLEALRAQARNAGIMTEEEVKRMEVLGDRWKIFMQSLERLKSLGISAALPDLEKFVTLLGDFLTKHKEQIVEFIKNFVIEFPKKLKELGKTALDVYKKLKPFINYFVRLVEMVGPANVIIAAFAGVILFSLIPAIASLATAFAALSAASLLTPFGQVLLVITGVALAIGLVVKGVMDYIDWMNRLKNMKDVKMGSITTAEQAKAQAAKKLEEAYMFAVKNTKTAQEAELALNTSPEVKAAEEEANKQGIMIKMGTAEERLRYANETSASLNNVRTLTGAPATTSSSNKVNVSLTVKNKNDSKIVLDDVQSDEDVDFSQGQYAY